jgi:hypothetical protein
MGIPVVAPSLTCSLNAARFGPGEKAEFPQFCNSSGEGGSWAPLGGEEGALLTARVVAVLCRTSYDGSMHNGRAVGVVKATRTTKAKNSWFNTRGK